MKKYFRLFAFVFLAGTLVMSSCKKDDDDDNGGTPAPMNPTINFLVEQGFISSDATVEVNEAFKVKIYAEENATSKKNIDHINVRRIFQNQTVGDTALDIGQPSATITVNFTAQPIPGEETLEFEAVDNDGKKAMISLKITTIEIGVNVTKYSNITLGSFNDQTYGSFFSTSNGQAYFKAEAFDNQALIDFAFFLGATSGASIGAPANDTIVGVFDLDQPPVWTTLNTTGMVSPAPITAADFDLIGTTYDFPNFQSSSSIATQLEDDDVIFFMTQGMKLGFIKVNSINKRGDIINIDVIVEQ